MTLAGLLIIVTLAQPVVRPLDVRGEVTTEAQVIAANEGFVWFTVGEADSFRGGGARVFRMSRDGGAVVDVIAGRDWRGVDAAPSSFTGVAVRVGGHGRGSALFTFDGEFEAHGRRLRSPAPTGLGIIAAGSNVLVVSREGVFLSTAPGQAQRLGDVNSFVEPVPSTDGRIALAVAGDAGLEVRIVDRDGGLVDGPPGRPVASAGATFLVERGQQLRNEKDELVAPVSEVLLQGNGQVVFWRPDRTVQVTDGTLAGTRFLTRTPSLLTGRFAVTNLFDGGMHLESFATGEARTVDERFFGEALQDRIVDRARELYEDGGIVRRAVHDCDWRRFEPATQELLCAFDGGLWSRPTPDSPEQLLGVLAPMGRATGARLSLVGPLVRGAALLVGFPGPTWTDGVIARTFENEGVVVGQSRGKVVLEVDGLTLVDPVSGARTALGLNVQWRAFPSLRELFIQRSDGATCALQRLDARGGFEDVEPVCLRELVDVPGGLLARDLQLGWLRWQPEERRFGALAITNAASLVDADDEWVHFGTTQGTFSSEEGFVDRSQHELLHWKTGKVLRSSPGSRVHLTPQGLFSWRDGEATLWTRAGEEFTLASAWPPLVSFTSRALWVVTNREVVRSTGGAFQLVTNDVTTWANPAAVGAVLFIRTERELVTLSASGETRRFGFVEARPSFATGDLRWFSLDDGVHGFEPWVFDGESLQLAADLNPGPASSYPYFLGLARGRLIVEAARPDGTIGWSSLEFEPPPPDPSAPVGGTGCGCRSTSALEASFVLVLGLCRRFRRR